MERSVHAIETVVSAGVRRERKGKMTKRKSEMFGIGEKLGRSIIEDLKKRGADARAKAKDCDTKGESHMESYWLGMADAVDYILTVYSKN